MGSPDSRRRLPSSSSSSSSSFSGLGPCVARPGVGRSRVGRARLGSTLRAFAIVVATSVVTVAGGAALADVFHLKSGGKIEGVLQGEEDGEYVIKTRVGTQRLAKSDVVRIERKESVRERYERRRGALDEDDVDAVIELAEWCRRERLVGEAEALFERAVELDPTREAAQKALGRVQHRGEWMTPAERDERVRREAIADKRASGLVEYEGEWVTVEERDARMQGLVFFEGMWRPPSQVQEMKGLVQDENGAWVHRDALAARAEAAELEKKLGVSLTLSERDSIIVMSALPDRHVDELAEKLSEGYRRFHETFGIDEDLLDRRLLPVLEVRERRKFQLYLDHFAEKHEMTEAWLSVAREASGTYHFDPPFIADFQAGRAEEHLVNSAVNKLGRILANRWYPNFNYLPAWYEEAIAVWLEVEVCGNCTTYYLGSPGVRNKGRYQQRKPDVSKRFDPNKGWILHGEWIARLKDAVETDSDTALQRLIHLEANEMGSLDIAKCWSFLDWLVRRDAQKFAAFVRELRSRLPRYERRMNTREYVEIQRKAFRTIYDRRLGELENEWQTEALGVDPK